MSIKTCKQHAKEPVFIYAECAGCEIQRYRDQEKALKAENEDLRNQLELQEMLGTPEQFLAAKDAERYRSMFASGEWDYSDDWYGLPKSDVDDLIDSHKQ